MIEEVSWRVFIAVPLPPDLRRELSRWESSVKLRERGWRVVRDENLHLTLRFLGNRPPARVAEIGAALERRLGRLASRSARLQGWGVFPHLSRPRVLWAGVGRGEEGLIELAENVDQGLADLEEPVRDRPFRAHLTLGRARGRRIELPGTPSSSEPLFGEFDVEEVLLIRSYLGSSGARYEVVDQFPLGLTDD